ncbi:MAG: AAA family ATPase [Burkholderiales bacterium]|nr:AAA family ATPase [Burkholderiales bacterium]
MDAEAAPCPRCRSTPPAGARFCPQCGAPLTASASTGERRQVAILFADLSGFTPLSQELGAEETHRLVSRYFELVDALVGQCGGSVDKHLGDAVMAVFGAPVAYGNDTLRALRAAVGVHAAMETLSREFGRALAAHVGVASGEVVAADTGSAVHRTYTVTGDAVNLAARLLELAKARETVISDEVYRACASAIEVDPVGTMPIRGFATEMPVWRLRSLRVEAAAEHPLFGREEQVARFAALLQAVESTGHGAAWLVRADPGMGKTRLVQELVGQARRYGFATYVSTVLDFGIAQGRDAIYAVLASILGVPAEGSAADRRAALEHAIASGAVPADDEPFAAEILGIAQRDPAMYEAMDHATRGDGRIRAVAHAVARASAQRPTLIVGEDLHWATPVVLAGVRAVIDVAQYAPLLVVCTSRREGDPFGVPPLDMPYERCELPPLATRDALALARSYLTANPDVAAGCVERAQGNPLFLTQLLRSGADGGDIPGTIQSVVLSRLDRLPPPDKAAVQAAAVVGLRFDLPVLQHLLDDTAYDASTLLGRDLVRIDNAEARRFAFVHALIRDGAYASLLTSRRRALHQRAAQWYEAHDPSLHAEHLDRAEDPRAAAAYLAAARSEAGALRFDAALRLARRGGVLAAPDNVRHDLARYEGDLARDTGDVAGSIAAFERALVHAGNDAQRCNAWLGVAAAHRATGAADAGIAVLDSVEPLANGAGLRRESSRAAYLRGCLEFARGNAQASQAAQGRALDHARAAGDSECEAQALSGLADVLYAEGRMRSALAAFEQCVDVCDRLGLARFSLNNRCMLAIVHSYLDPADARLPELDRVRQVARELRQPAAEVMADETEGWVRVVQDLYELAIEPTERSLALARKIGARRWMLFDFGLLAFAYWHTGRNAEAATALREALALAEDASQRFIGGVLHGARALMAERRDDLARVLADGERTLAQGSPAHTHYWFRRAAIDALLAHGDHDGVLRQADALEPFAKAEDVPWVSFQVARARALVAAGEGRPDQAALLALRERAQALRLPGALPAIDAALARL